jgi:hypothetical protein
MITRQTRSFIGMKGKETVFICRFSESGLKVIKCRMGDNSGTEFLGLEQVALSATIDDAGLAKALQQVLSRLKFNNNPLILCVPRGAATSRFIKIPTKDPDEIENIASLQAPRFLPYSLSELVTGFEVISGGSDGYYNINLAIMHKAALERYIKIFDQLKIKKFRIILSSYGLSNLYEHLRPKQDGPVMLMDIDSTNAELAIVSQGKLLFSRSFGIKSDEKGFLADLASSEIRQTIEAYSREVQEKIPGELVIFSSKQQPAQFVSDLSEQAGISLILEPYLEKITSSPDFSNAATNLDGSVASLVGLGLRGSSEALDLLPRDIRDKNRRAHLLKERLRATMFIACILLVWALALSRHIENKQMYLSKLKSEVARVVREAGPLAKMESRLALLDKRSGNKLSAQGALYALYKITPDKVNLTSFEYEEEKSLIIRGQAAQLNAVFDFAKQLSASEFFRNFNVKVTYATQKNTGSAELADFEIACINKES